MADEIKTPTYEEVAAQVKARNVDYGDGPRPDMPRTEAAPAYGDPGHVNPAINPAPAPVVSPERIIVPVINDPGVLGGGPTLAELNRAARADTMQRAGEEKFSKSRPEIDDTGGVTEESNQAEVKAAAEARMAKLAEAQDAAKEDAAVTSSERASPPPPVKEPARKIPPSE